MLVVSTPGRPAGADREPCRGLPGRGNDVVHTPLRKCHHQWRCVRRPNSGRWSRAVVTRHLHHLWATRESLPAGDHRRGHHLPCPTVPFSRTPGPDGGDRWVAHTGIGGHLPLRPPATVVWHRLAWPPTRGGGDADAGRAGPGRRKVSGEVGEFTLPQSLVLLQADPLGLHNRRRLIEQAGRPGGVGRHVTPPLSPNACAAGPAVRRAVVSR